MEMKAATSIGDFTVADVLVEGSHLALWVLPSAPTMCG
jgi:hypothetical protein